jgi:hypothetical protein
MRTFAALGLFACLALAGCASKAKVAPGPPGPVPALMQGEGPPASPPRDVVFVRGPVRNALVVWTDDLTLAKALVEADYIGQRDPRVITVTRHGQVFRISPRRLLSGLEDPPLEPGDIIEVQQ